MIYNFNGQIPNIFHFQGRAKGHYHHLFNKMALNSLTNADNIKFVIVATDENLSPVISQLKRNGIDYVNPYKKTFYHSWSNSMKISLILEALEGFKYNDLVVVMDGYDTAIQTLDGIRDRYKQCGIPILYNATKHNHPDIIIDIVKDRDLRGEFKYFNAGCCIGTCSALKQFYTKCQERLEQEPINQWDSEQYTVRQTFNLMQDMVDFDSQCNIFQTMGSTHLVVEDDKITVL